MKTHGRFTIDGHPRLELWVFHHHVMNGNSTPAESHNANSLGMTLLLQILQDCIELSKKQKGKLFKGNNLVVQWLQLSTSTARAGVHSPVRELRPSKFHGTAPTPPRQKKKGIVWPLESEPGSKCQWLQGFVSSCSGGSEIPTFRALSSCPADE